MLATHVLLHKMHKLDKGPICPEILVQKHVKKNPHPLEYQFYQFNKSARGSVRNIATMFTQVDIIFGLSSKHWSWIHTENSWIWKEDHPKNIPARIDIFWQWFLRRMKCETNLQQQASQNRKYHTWKTVLSTWHQWHAEGSGDCPKYPFQGASNQRIKLK